MDRDELVERVAAAIYEATRESHQKPWADIATGVGVGPKLSTWFMDRRRAEARAALAIIEHVVRDDERGRCAALVKGWVPWRSDINPPLAAAIRARQEEGA